MGKTEVSYKFKRVAYVGKVHLVDVNTKEAVMTGHGSFDTQELRLLAQFSDGGIASHDSVLTVLETADGYFAPLTLMDFHAMGWGGQAYRMNMKQCMHWPISDGLTYVLEKFGSLQISIDSKTEEEYLNQKLSGDFEAKMVKTARFSEISAFEAPPYAVKAIAGYTYTARQDNVRSDEHIKLDGIVTFNLDDLRGQHLDFLSLKPALAAFKAYWLMAHSNVDCSMRSFKMGHIDFIFQHNTLLSPYSDSPDFRSIIEPSVEFHLDTLLKCFYFMLNPEEKDDMSLSSKVGLALSSLVRYAYDDRAELLDHQAVGLIAGFQSLLELIAQNKIKQDNKATKTETMAAIERTLEAIKAIEGELPETVKEFYLKGKGDIYTALSRPTFMRAVDIVFDELDLDKTKYATTISVINKARQQIVHHQNYDSDFLMNLITTRKVDVVRDKDGHIVQMALGIKVGELDNLYDLTLEIARRYFERNTLGV